MRRGLGRYLGGVKGRELLIGTTGRRTDSKFLLTGGGEAERPRILGPWAISRSIVALLL